MTAYYNEIDEYAAQWLRNLIAAGHIAPGDVDTRSITEVHPDDIKKYTQCHFFAGIGVWSHALRRSGWSDSRPVWTGSCPCQPFSTAGKGAGFDDERHLWPVFGSLIRECRPPTVFGEQVASKDADAWIDLVQADLEVMGYAVGAVPFPAAGVGAPHIRDRLYWMANAGGARSKAWIPAPSRGYEGESGELDDGCCKHAFFGQRPTISRLADTMRQGLFSSPYAGVYRSEKGAGSRDGKSERFGTDGRLANAESKGFAYRRSGTVFSEPSATCGKDSAATTSPTNSFWRDADWLLCRDGKWRPVEPGTFPLAHGNTNRVGRLRAYGNAICAEAAVEFIKIAMEYRT